MSKATEEEAERLALWKSQWDEDKTGWHETTLHAALLHYGDLLLPSAATKSSSESDPSESSSSTTSKNNQFTDYRVFFPLCGKTVDMAHIARLTFVREVVGVDGIQKALDAFAHEHPEFELQTGEPIGGYDRLVGKKLTLLRGDYFEMDETVTGGRFEAVFDRASLVAIDPSLRDRYMTTMSKLLAPGGRILLVTIERLSGTDEDKTGPPYSMPEAEVRRLYEGQPWVKSVTLIPGDEGRNKGTAKVSHFFLIQAK